MSRLTDVPYSNLKANRQDYEIMLLRDLYNNTFADIAKAFAVSVSTASNSYYRIKWKQLRCYINHLAIVNGHESTAMFKKLLRQVYDCYQDCKYVSAYFETKYQEILAEYRDGEPGLREQFLAALPPFKEKWSSHMISRVVELREDKKLAYPQIAQKLKMTSKSAEWIYQHYYHQKFMALSDKIMVDTGETDIRRKYFKQTSDSKKRYALLRRDYADE